MSGTVTVIRADGLWKRCSNCGIEKHERDYYARTGGRWLPAKCIECTKAYVYGRRRTCEVVRQGRREYQKVYRQKHKARCRMTERVSRNKKRLAEERAAWLLQLNDNMPARDWTIVVERLEAV